MTAAQSVEIEAALGAKVLTVAEKIEGQIEAGLRVPDSLWRQLLTTLQRNEPELMATIPGRFFALLVEERIHDNRFDDPGGAV